MEEKFKLRIVSRTFRYGSRGSGKIGKRRVNILEFWPERYVDSWWLDFGEKTYLGKVARRFLLNGKICEIRENYQYFPFAEGDRAFIKAAKTIGAKKWRFWKELMESKDEDWKQFVLDEIKTRMIAESLSSQDLEEFNGNNCQSTNGNLRSLHSSPRTFKSTAHF